VARYLSGARDVWSLQSGAPAATRRARFPAVADCMFLRGRDFVRNSLGASRRVSPPAPPRGPDLGGLVWRSSRLMPFDLRFVVMLNLGGADLPAFVNRPCLRSGPSHLSYLLPATFARKHGRARRASAAIGRDHRLWLHAASGAPPANVPREAAPIASSAIEFSPMPVAQAWRDISAETVRQHGDVFGDQLLLNTLKLLVHPRRAPSGRSRPFLIILLACGAAKRHRRASRA